MSLPPKTYRAVLAGTGIIADAHVRAVEATNGRVVLVAAAGGFVVSLDLR